MTNKERNIKVKPDVEGQPVRFSMAMSPCRTVFAPLVFTGRLEEGIKRLAEKGFDGVEISISREDDLDAGWLAKRLSETGLEVSAFATGRLCLEKSICLSDPQPEARKMALRELTSIIKLAARFSAPVIIGGVRGKLTGETTQWIEQRAAAVNTLRKCAGVAEDLGICLLVEPINHYETNFINSAREGLEFIDEIGKPAVRLLLDTFHMNIEEADLCASIRQAGHRLGYVHFADNNRLAPGLGHIDFRSLFLTLVEIGFSGFISAKVLPLPDDTTALEQSGEFFHAMIGWKEESNLEKEN